MATIGEQRVRVTFNPEWWKTFWAFALIGGINGGTGALLWVSI